MLAALATVAKSPVTLQFAKQVGIRLGVVAGVALAGDTVSAGVGRRRQERRIAREDALSYEDTSVLFEKIEQTRRTQAHLVSLQRAAKTTEYNSVISRLSIQIIEMERELSKLVKAHVVVNRDERSVRMRREVKAWEGDFRKAWKTSFHPISIMIWVTTAVMGVAFQFGDPKWFMERFPTSTEAVAKAFSRVAIAAESLFWGTVVFTGGWKISRWHASSKAAKNYDLNVDDAREAIHNLVSNSAAQELLDKFQIDSNKLIGVKSGIRQSGYDWANGVVEHFHGYVQVDVDNIRRAILVVIADEKIKGNYVPSRAAVRAFIAGARKRFNENNQDGTENVVPIAA